MDLNANTVAICSFVTVASFIPLIELEARIFTVKQARGFYCVARVVRAYALLAGQATEALGPVGQAAEDPRVYFCGGCHKFYFQRANFEKVCNSDGEDSVSGRDDLLCKL